MTNERRVDDELQEQRVIHPLELVIEYNQSVVWTNYEKYGGYCAYVDG